MNKRRNRLLLGENVEVRQLEERFRGSWQLGRVIGVSESARDVRYEKLIGDDGMTQRVERVGFSDSVDGSITYRGRIRPVQRDYGTRDNVFWYGLCVDVLYEDGWWEGVVLDHEVGLEERAVFFPDGSQELRFSVDKLRVTLDWDEAEGGWTVRGTWKFLVLIDELTCNSAGVSADWIKQLWYISRQNHVFLQRISEWTLGDLFMWRELIKQVMNCHQLKDSTGNNGFVAVIPSDYERSHHKDGSCVGSAKVINSCGDRQTGSQAFTAFVMEFAENASTELPIHMEGRSLASAPTMIKNSDAPTSCQSFVSSVNVVYEDCHGAGSANSLNDGPLAEQYLQKYTEQGNSKIVGSSEKGKANDKNLPSGLKYNFQAIVDYVNMRNKTPHGKGNKELTEKARMHLKAIGWKVEHRVSKDHIVTFRYISPEGKYDLSLTSACRNLIAQIVNESNGREDQETAGCRESVAVVEPGLHKEQLQYDITGLRTIFMDDRASGQGVVQQRMACESDKDPDHRYQFGYTEEAELSPEDRGSHQISSLLITNRDETSESSAALMDYAYMRKQTRMGKGNTELSGKARMHLRAMGWKVECKTFKDNAVRYRYISPQGKYYQSLTGVCRDLIPSMVNESNGRADREAAGCQELFANRDPGVNGEQLQQGITGLHPTLMDDLALEQGESDERPDPKAQFYVACSAYDQWEQKYGNNLTKCKENKITSKNGQRCSLQSHSISDSTLPENHWLVEPESACEESVPHEVDSSLGGTPNMVSPVLKDGTSYSFVDVEMIIPDNLKDKEHGKQDCSIENEMRCTDFLDILDQFLDCDGEMVCSDCMDVDQFLEFNDEENNPTISQCHENEIQTTSDLSSNCHNVLKVERCPPPGIEVGERVCFQKQLVPVDEMPERGLVISGPRHGRQPRCQKRKRGRPAKTCLTRSYARTKSLLAPSTSRSVKSTLSWLIDNNVVLPREKVFYIGKGDKRMTAEGRITSKGIVCSCCTKIYSLIKFQAHAGSNDHQPAAHIFLKDGRSLLQCQMEVLSAKQRTTATSGPCKRMKIKGCPYESDYVCSICYYGGSLILCDQCPSSFHLSCVNLKALPEGEWFCPFCRCAICGQSDFSDVNGKFSEMAVLYCDQCELEYHVGCWTKREKRKLEENFLEGHWFCSRKCSKIFLYLHTILGKPNSTPVKDLHWTILQSSTDLHTYDDSILEKMAEFHSKISIAHEVLHECFVPVVERRTKSDLVADVLFNRSSELNRLNFRGFYTILLERGDELISVAVIRIHGERVAEMPLIATRAQYRHQGMCRLLVSELENMLSALGVERMILPAAPQVRDTWTGSFGFTEMTAQERYGLLGYTFLDFQDTTMCQKLLSSPNKEKKSTEAFTKSGEVKYCNMSHRSSEDIPTLHRQALNIDSHPVGENSVEPFETDFLREISEGCSMQISAADLICSSVKSPRQCDPENIYGKHHRDVNKDREIIANIDQGCGDNAFKPTRIADGNMKRMKHTTFCN